MCMPARARVRGFSFYPVKPGRELGLRGHPRALGQQEGFGLAGGPVAQLGARGGGGWRCREPKALASLREPLSRPGSDQWAVIIPRRAGSRRGGSGSWQAGAAGGGAGCADPRYFD